MGGGSRCLRDVSGSAFIIPRLVARGDDYTRTTKEARDGKVDREELEICESRTL